MDVGGHRLYILGAFSFMRYYSLRRFPVPLVSTGSAKVSLRHWRFYDRVPFRESREGESPRGGVE